MLSADCLVHPPVLYCDVNPLACQPAPVLCRYGLGQIDFRQEKYEVAATHFQRAISVWLTPHCHSVHAQHACCTLTMRDANVKTSPGECLGKKEVCQGVCSALRRSTAGAAC